MPTYLITLHADRSWTEDNPRGYVQRGKPGIQPPQRKLANYRASIANHPPVKFSREQIPLAIEIAHEVCETLGALPIAASCTATHLHIVVDTSNSTARKGGAPTNEPQVNSPLDPKKLAARIKSIVGLRLSQQLGTTGNRWFSRGEDVGVVADQKHLEYLIATYLPRHELVERSVFKCWNVVAI